MSLGYKVGEDEHAAYIAGFAGKCATDVICEIDKKKENTPQGSKEEVENQAMDSGWSIMAAK